MTVAYVGDKFRNLETTFQEENACASSVAVLANLSFVISAHANEKGRICAYTAVCEVMQTRASIAVISSRIDYTMIVSG